MTDPWQPVGGGPPASPPPPGGGTPSPGYPPAPAPGYPGAPGGPGSYPPPGSGGYGPPPGPGGFPPAPGGPGWGPQYTARGYDGFAIAALVLGILPCVPLGLIFGIIALRRIGRSGQQGRSLAIAGIVLSVVWVGLFALGAVVGGDAERDEDGTITDAGDEDVFDLRAGDCFNDPPADEELQSVAAVPCSEPHDAEVYAEFDTVEEGGDYPGEAALTTEAEQGCFEQFEPFVGTAPESSALTIHFLLPTQMSWDSLDDREITCIVVDPSGPTTGSLADTSR